MGQRLLMHFTTIKDDENNHDIATVWSHWGGYTGSAIKYTNDFLKAFSDTKTLFPKSSLITQFLLAVGPSTDCGIEEKDKKKAATAIKTYDHATLLPKDCLVRKSDSDKNILTIFPNNDSSNRESSEADVFIYLDTMHADVGQLYTNYNGIKEYNKDRSTRTRIASIKGADIIKEEIDISNASAKDIELLYEATKINEDNSNFVLMNGSPECLLSIDIA